MLVNYLSGKKSIYIIFRYYWLLKEEINNVHLNCCLYVHIITHYIYPFKNEELCIFQ